MQQQLDINSNEDFYLDPYGQLTINRIDSEVIYVGIKREPLSVRQN